MRLMAVLLDLRKVLQSGLVCTAVVARSSLAFVASSHKRGESHPAKVTAAVSQLSALHHLLTAPLRGR
ncbi:hypothetical protein AOLI_G00099310 [Acnodon oligacanthus]